MGDTDDMGDIGDFGYMGDFCYMGHMGDLCVQLGSFGFT